MILEKSISQVMARVIYAPFDGEIEYADANKIVITANFFILFFDVEKQKRSPDTINTSFRMCAYIAKTGQRTVSVYVGLVNHALFMKIGFRLI